MAKSRCSNSSKSDGSILDAEDTLWAAVDRLRYNMDAAKYNHADQGVDLKGPDKYQADNIF